MDETPKEIPPPKAEKTPFERMRDLTRHILQVPKSEAERRKRPKTPTPGKKSPLRSA